MPQNPQRTIVGQSGTLPRALATDATGGLISGTGRVVTTAAATGTIAATGTFQNALAANAARLPGGAITNNGTNVMQVYLAADSATAAKAIDLAGGTTLFLTNVFGPTQVYRGAIQITGTISDTFATLELT